MACFVFDHGQEQFVSRPIDGGHYCVFDRSVRYAFLFLDAMIWIAVPLLWIVDAEKGRIGAGSYVEELI